jgi:hypothetical protein
LTEHVARMGVVNRMRTGFWWGGGPEGKRPCGRNDNNKKDLKRGEIEECGLNSSFRIGTSCGLL